jgi:hypothetical protein
MSAHAIVLRDSLQAVAYVTGEPDVDTAPASARHSWMPSPNMEQVTIDLRRLGFCDYASLSAAHKRRPRTRHHPGLPPPSNWPDCCAASPTPSVLARAVLDGEIIPSTTSAVRRWSGCSSA